MNVARYLRARNLHSVHTLVMDSRPWTSSVSRMILRMEIEVGIIAGGIFLVIVAIFQAVEQRRIGAAYREALAESKAQANETVEQQRETNRWLALIAEEIDAQQK